MTGAKTVLLYRYAVVPLKYGSRTVKPRLTIQCPPKKPVEFIVGLDFPIARTSEGRARIKFDDQPPKTVTGTRSDDGASLFLPGAPGVIKALAKAKEFRVEVTPVTGSPIVLEFLVDGLSSHTKTLADCGVKL